VRGMAKAVGVLTSRGGLASHAAVVARGWGIPAVVGAESVHLGQDSIEIGGVMYWSGETITIDGSTGDVYAGEVAGHREVAPEAATLLRWAADLGIDIEADSPDAPDARDAPVAPDAPDAAGQQTRLEVAADDVSRALLVKGAATLEQLSEALLAPPDDLQTLVDALVQERSAEMVHGQIRLTAAGKLDASALFERDRATLGAERSGTLLEEFHALDLRMKDIVTGWQVRDIGGQQVLNDHSDTAYDSRLLGDLAALHEETAAWLTPISTSLPAFGVYSLRLAAALDRARLGDQRFVASPRVDSYHGVWFELHEHLIRLAGRKRSDEAAAGRA
jgi:pyruvate,orthophosphate dikinase